MNNLRYCFNCREDVEYRLFSRVETRIVKGERIRVRIDYALCKKCGEPVDVPKIASENEIRVFDAYKKKVGLLTSLQIKDIRRRYGLSATKFAKLLGMGEKSITRYENGAIQTKEVDLLLRLVRIPQNYELINHLGPVSLSLEPWSAPALESEKAHHLETSSWSVISKPSKTGPALVGGVV